MRSCVVVVLVLLSVFVLQAIADTTNIVMIMAITGSDGRVTERRVVVQGWVCAGMLQTGNLMKVSYDFVSTNAFTIATEYPTNNFVYWYPKPFCDGPLVIKEVYAKSYGCTATVNIVKQDRTQPWTTYTQLATNVPANSVGTAYTTFSATAVITNNQRIGFYAGGVSSFAVGNKMSVDFKVVKQ